MATAEELREVSRLLADAVLILQWCASRDALVLNEEEATEPVVSPDDLREDYAAAVEQLMGLIGDYEAYFERTGGIERWGPVVDAAGWSGPLLRFKLRILRRGGRSRVVNWAGGRRPPIPRRLLEWFLKLLNIALDSLGVIPGVDLIKELKEFLEAVAGGAGGGRDQDGSDPDDNQDKPEGGPGEPGPGPGHGPASWSPATPEGRSLGDVVI